MALSAGDRLGPYEVLGLLGSGGMGDVYRARDTRLDRFVAIKVSKEQFSERFDREARAVAALNHPNICQLYDVGPNYLVMEHIEGGPIHATGDPHTLLELGAQIADGLAAAHRAGIVHRDLKPGNIFVTRDGRVKILDFGLALLEPALVQGMATQTMAVTNPGTTVGTVAYVSPEQARGEAVDARADLWSVGVVLYELATRARPFEGGTTALLFDAILNKVPVPVRERNPRVPAQLSQTIEKLLEKDRSLRYQSAADLRADLKRGERDSTSRGVTVPAPAPASRSRRMLALAAAAVVVVAVGAGGFFWQRTQATPLTERDIVVLSDVTNTTGEPVFDTTLRAALSIQLEQSPFLKIMTDDQMREGLQRMERPASERITADVAREICQRFGEKATITGEIAKLGAAYALTLRAVNCRNGETLAQQQVQARDQESVLGAVSAAAKDMRGRLGESLASIEQLDRPLSQVTTSSLEAFRAFALGAERMGAGDNLGAIKHLERATELDPNFAMAWWFMASAYLNAGVGNRPAFIDKAFALRDRLGEGERLSLETAYYAQRAGEWDKASDSAQRWAKTYPRVALPHFVQVGLRTFGGRPDEALREALEASRLEPRNTVMTAGLIGMYARMDRFDEAKAVAAAALDKDGPDVHLNLLRIAYIQNDASAIDRETRWFAGKPEEYLGVAVQALSALALGQRQRSTQLFQQSAEMAKRRGLPAGGGGVTPADDALFGNCPATPNPANPVQLVIALCGGDLEAALKAANEAATARPTVSALNLVQLPMLRAAVELRRN
jgi:tetratricopeptide (TPR) repeat protein/predicted Ser/Thr protein kinase